MTSADLCQAIIALVPNAQFVYQGTGQSLEPHTNTATGDPCTGLSWIGPGAAPTMDQITTKAAELAAIGVPNWSGFMADMKVVWNNNYDILRAMAQKYPLFVQYLNDQNAGGVKSDILAAYNAVDITKPPTTNDQYTAIKAAIAANNIPITGLP